jgi:hypothetical protein
MLVREADWRGLCVESAANGTKRVKSIVSVEAVVRNCPSFLHCPFSSAPDGDEIFAVKATFTLIPFSLLPSLQYRFTFH